MCACQGANRAVEDAERERREREERLRHGRNPGARGMASASGRARAAQDVAAPSPLNPAAHTGQHTHTHTHTHEWKMLKSTNWRVIHFLKALVLISAYDSLSFTIHWLHHLTSFTFPSFRFREGEEGEHASSSRGTCQHLLLRPDGAPGYISHVHLTGNTHTHTKTQTVFTYVMSWGVTIHRDESEISLKFKIRLHWYMDFYIQYKCTWAKIYCQKKIFGFYKKDRKLFKKQVGYQLCRTVFK